MGGGIMGGWGMEKHSFHFFVIYIIKAKVDIIQTVFRLYYCVSRDNFFEL